jgi:hypothetical protein
MSQTQAYEANQVLLPLAIHYIGAALGSLARKEWRMLILCNVNVEAETGLLNLTPQPWKS